MYVASSQSLIRFFLGSPFMLFGLIILELFAVSIIVARLDKLSVAQASLIFLGYSLLNGITLSGLFIMYTGASVSLAFFITAATFGAMTFYGYTTESDLSSLGKLVFMGLIGIIIASVINIFLQSAVFYWLISYAGVAVFIGLTAWDVQKLKRISENITDEEGGKKLAIYGALTLYLDFINLFLFILRIVGNRSRDF